MAIGTPLTFYWLDGQQIAGLLCNSGTTIDGTTYYTVALFDGTNDMYYYQYARNVNDGTPGSFQVVSNS